jgi:hypothetical protein
VHVTARILPPSPSPAGAAKNESYYPTEHKTGGRHGRGGGGQRRAGTTHLGSSRRARQEIPRPSLRGRRRRRRPSSHPRVPPGPVPRDGAAADRPHGHHPLRRPQGQTSAT